MVDVYVLVKCRGLEHLPISLLVFDTIRVGFPTARLHVYDNASDFGSSEIGAAAAATAIDASNIVHLDERMARGDFIARILETATGPTVFVDTDMIFWESCEEFAFPKETLYAGRLIPEAMECGWRMPARIHPSLFFVPDPAALRAALAPFSKRLWYFKPFQGYTVLDGGAVVCWDVNSTLYAALPGAAYAFGEAELDRYDHLFAGTYADRLEEIGMDARTTAKIRLTHAVALSPDRASLRGLWREQIPSPELENLPSWHYWSGVLSGGDAEIGFMHAVFETPGLPPFAHTSVVDLATKEVYAGNSWKLYLSVPDLPAPLVPKRHAAEGEYHASDTVAVAGLDISIAGKRYEGMSGKLWYEREKRNVRPSDGWRWISMRLDDGRSVMLYDHTDKPPRYAVRAEGEWTSANAKVTVLNRMAYESKWAVRLDSETFTIVQRIPGQEIVDEAHGIRYLEALCEVYANDALAGTAYVEIVPAAPKPNVRVIPSEAEMHLKWTQNDHDAALLIDFFGYATQLADDLVDLDRKGVLSVQGRSLVMADLLYTLLIKIPGNTFFRKHEEHFIPLFTNCLVLWDASNAWAESDKKETKMFSYVQREAAGRLVEHVAYLIGGFQWSKQVARELHEYYHGANMVESFEQFEAECKEKRQ